MKKYQFLVAVCATTLLAVAPSYSQAAEQSTDLPINSEAVGQMENELNNALNEVENGVQTGWNIPGESATPSMPEGVDPMPMPTDPETNTPMLPSNPGGANPMPLPKDPETGLATPMPMPMPSEPGVANPMPMPTDPETNTPMLPSNPGGANPMPLPIDPETGLATPMPMPMPSAPGVADPMPMPIDPETNMPMLPSNPGGANPMPLPIDPETGLATPMPMPMPSAPGLADPMPMPLDPETNMPMLPTYPGLATPMPMPLDPQTNMPMLPSVSGQSLVELENSIYSQVALGNSEAYSPLISLAMGQRTEDPTFVQAGDTLPQTGERNSSSVLVAGILTVFASLGTIILKKFK